MTRLLPVAQNTDLVSLNVIAGGVALPGRIHVRSVEIQRSVGRIPFARLTLEDGDPGAADFAASAEPFFAAGQPVVIEAGYHGAAEPVFEGIVVRQRIGVRDGRSWLEVECRDKAVRMTLTRRIRRFEDKTDSAAIDDILGDYDLDGDLAPTEVTHPQLVQYQTTDWDFVVARLDANGQLLAVEDGTLRSFAPELQPEAAAEVRYGTNLIELDAEFDARTQPEAVTAVAWDPASQALVSVDAADPAWTAPGDQDAAAMVAASGRRSDALWHGGMLASDALQAWADGRLLRDRIANTRGRARCQGFATLRLGDTLALSGVGARFEGGVLVTGLRHLLEGGTWTLDVEFGADPAFHAERFDIRAPAASALAAPAEGLATGVVTKIHDDPQGEGRVRVRLTLADGDTEGVWARLATLDAGAGRGAQFRPEPDDEVIVGFLSGDPAHPVILGALHSSARTAPEAPTMANDRKGYTSREGLKLVFDDKAKAIVIQTPGGNSVTLSDEDGGIVIADQNGNTISLTSDGIAFDSAKAMTLKAGGDLKGEGVNVELAASASLKAEGSASAALSSSGALEVSGSVVMIN